MNHEERVRKFSTPWEEKTPEQRERITRVNEEADRMRAEGKVVPPSLQERHDDPVLDLAEPEQDTAAEETEGKHDQRPNDTRE